MKHFKTSSTKGQAREGNNERDIDKERGERTTRERKRERERER